ncbi:bifunctional 3-(3-hydroxy-phenyl)propionate/3-hydroxycinnamic acid hydroxylase [Novosphingobium sp.]|uniref:bifunctional 3-(3-hydroxy-phenyl)propionate/3-hydroxycinnamic acid hydroxylase MhpA n=1 Tax=Novosphingobium sp. TaxID=1874826 RepID=UPI0038BD5A36
MKHDFDCDLLVVGLGPVGDALAALATIQGLKVIAIDRSSTIFPLPRAAVFDHEIMRIFQAIGVAERIAPLCRIPDRYQFLTADRQVLLDFPVAPVGAFGWAETYALHQPAVEQVLRDRLTELDVQVELGVAFERMAQDEAGVTVDVTAGAEPRQIRARYVVGCDGSWSPVREALGIKLDDYNFDEPWLVLDTIIEEPGDLPIVCQQLCDPERPVTHMAMSGKRFRWEFMLKPGESPEEMLDDARIRALLEPWDCVERIAIERKAVYRFHALVAEKWRVGRILIAGDAAHQMPPFAGQGMCSGIRDAANLAWKLGAVIRAEADEAILDTYQQEREPHVRAIIATAIAMGQIVCLLDPAAAEGRNQAMLARKSSGAQDVSVAYPDLVDGFLTRTPHAGALFPQPRAADGELLDAVCGNGPVLVTRSDAQVRDRSVRAISLDAPEIAKFAAPLGQWLAAAAADAVLIRPDRHVFGTGCPDELQDAWRAMAGKAAVG